MTTRQKNSQWASGDHHESVLSKNCPPRVSAVEKLLVATVLFLTSTKCFFGAGKHGSRHIRYEVMVDHCASTLNERARVGTFITVQWSTQNIPNDDNLNPTPFVVSKIYCQVQKMTDTQMTILSCWMLVTLMSSQFTIVWTYIWNNTTDFSLWFNFWRQNSHTQTSTITQTVVTLHTSTVLQLIFTDNRSWTLTKMSEQRQHSNIQQSLDGLLDLILGLLAPTRHVWFDTSDGGWWRNAESYHMTKISGTTTLLCDRCWEVQPRKPTLLHLWLRERWKQRNRVE